MIIIIITINIIHTNVVILPKLLIFRNTYYLKHKQTNRINLKHQQQQQQK